MGLKDKILGFVAPVDEDDEEEVFEYTQDETENISTYEQSNNMMSQKLSADTKLVLFEPRSFDEAEEIAKHLKSRRAAVINLHRVQREYAQRTIDFLTGVVFALDGSIQKIGHNVILCTPRAIGVHGEISLDDEEQ